MYNDIIIVGAGGLGREVLWLLDELNQCNQVWNIKGFVDDNEKLLNTYINGYPVLGGVDWLASYKNPISVVCCIAKPLIRFDIIKKLKKNPRIVFPNVISKDVRYSNRVCFGEGNIICLSSTLTVDIQIGNFNIINPACTVGHDVIIKNYVTVYPGVNVSGNVIIGNQVEVGTGSQIIQGLNISDNIIIGAGSVVISDINEKGTYVGAPVKKVK
ncbi:acetyltransferase [Mobilitalea sibirica]|uniref:Acetyltransferase n=1 Tax=Mobilitalea sibirica TaxID=1462919 RepID=A0A8J7H418_9FIRM|nr:acetyltransferase [Mobilitalea sibirica]MBH1942043.1 acetyltransferase [Mobilitalea sibirica]